TPSCFALFYSALVRSFFFMTPRPQLSTLFPYTTLFRSHGDSSVRLDRAVGNDRRWIDDLRRCDRAAACRAGTRRAAEHEGICGRSEEHTSELQSPYDLVCRLLLEKKKSTIMPHLFCNIE